MRASLTPPLLLLALAASAPGCARWGNLPEQSYTSLDAPLWDPTAAVATEHGVYVPLPHAGGLALVSSADGGRAERIDLGEGTLTRLSAAPGGTTLVGFVDRTMCDYEGDDKPPKLLSDCDRNERVTTTELAVIRGTEVEPPVALEGAYNAITWSDDGTYGVAWLDFSDPDFEVTGVLNLTSVAVLDLARGLVTPVPVGFAADRILFVNGSGGSPERAVVLSQNSVAVVDLLPEVPEKIVTFPLTLDPDNPVTPVDVALTPDGRYALISVKGASDLYALDLLNESINIVELSGKPAAMAVNTELDRTVLVYGNGSMVDVLEHEFFDIDTLSLDEPMTDIANGTDFAVLYNTANGHDAYRLDLDTNVVTEYRLQNPAVSLHVAPTEEFAIALTRAEDGFNGGGDVGSLYDANPGMEIIDLDDDESQPFLLEGMGIDVAWAATQTALHALVLQEGIDYLYQLDLYTGRADELELSEPPVGIGEMQDGTFYITHPSPLGLITFLDPATGKTVEVAGFGALGLADSIELFVPDEEN